ncbi:uncharacterized protein PV06_04152 [Exophiala oligosperma]|uniref:Major facilitator superfamily (MFS) profile domain-containing protein n=1 Tax=Exophiala oligosperma TaxID=215243 RepID=A0A0D2DS21_9EURO|nr:uncharacterized protein PV06_04152 [Exophiala oligosperma]KIW45798.1 hypothetical protein PV06_04152 [Exophiala oligosperma]
MMNAKDPSDERNVNAGDCHVETIPGLAKDEKEPGPVENGAHNEVIKGDDSDGRLNWSATSILAYICLTFIFTGSQQPLYFTAGSLEFIIKDVGGSSTGSWLPIAYTLAAAVPIPFAGYLQDIFGRRLILLFATSLTMVGLIILGTAHSFPQAVVAMALCGTGAGIAELAAFAGVTEVVPVKARGYSVAFMTVVATPFGPYPLYCQLLSTRATWRWGIWMVLIFQGIALLGAALLYFPSKHSRLVGLARKDVIKNIDYVGGLLSLAGLTLLLVALNNGGYLYHWKSAKVLVPLILGIVAIGAFVVWERYFAKVPIAPRVLFRGSIIPKAFIISFVGGVNFYSLSNFAPIYFTNVYHTDPVTTGARGIGLSLGVIWGAVLGATFVSRFPKYAKWCITICCAIMTSFIGSLAAGNPSNPGYVVAASTIGGLAVGGLIVPASTYATVACPDDLIATTVGLILALRAVGGSIGFAIYYNIFRNKLDTKLPTTIAQYAVQAGLPLSSATEFVTNFLTNATALATVPGVTPAIIAAGAEGSRWAFASSLKYIFYTSIPFGVIATGCAMWLGDITPLMTNRIVATLNH